MRKILDVNIGDVFGDYQCIDIYKEKGKSDKYEMRCLKCGRTKFMLSSTIRNEKGITHKSCGKGLRIKNKYFYSRWKAMRTRTTNPKYEHFECYGGRNISSDEFVNFIDFYDAMYDSFVEKANEIGEENTSLDRINPNGDYTRKNCRWIHKNEQQKNTRKSIKFIAVYPDGNEEMCDSISEFANKNSLDYESIRCCLNGKYKQHKKFKFIKL
jgi:hypothetical protein